MNNRLYVGNLSFNTTEETLREAMTPFGEVQSIDIPTDRETGRMRGFAFVTMAKAESAAKAISELDGSTLDGRPLRVSVAQERTQRSGGGGGGGGGRGPGSRNKSW